MRKFRDRVKHWWHRIDEVFCINLGISLQEIKIRFTFLDFLRFMFDTRYGDIKRSRSFLLLRQIEKPHFVILFNIVKLPCLETGIFFKIDHMSFNVTLKFLGFSFEFQYIKEGEMRV